MSRRPCQVDGCASPHRARGYCGAHYEAARRSGEFTPLREAVAVEGVHRWPKRSADCDLGELLLERSEPAGDGTGCRLWLGGSRSKGYGSISIGGRHRYVHVVAHELWVGPIPEGYDVDHVRARGCRHRNCIEPAHLEAVTHLENTRRQPRSPNCPKGHPMTGDNIIINIQRGRYRCRNCRTCSLARKSTQGASR